MRIRIVISSLVLLFMAAFAAPSWAAPSVTGTSWRTMQPDGHVKLITFRDDGTCYYTQEKSPSGNEGKTFDNCRWEQNNDVLMFHPNQYYKVYIAIIEGESLTGYYVTNRLLAHGTFTGLRVN